MSQQSPPVGAASSDVLDESSGRVRRVTPPGIVLLVAAGGVFTAFVDATIVNTIFPEIERDFDGSSISALSWIFNAYSIVIAAFLIPAGRIADVIGRRRVFRAGLAVFTLGSVLCAVAPTLGMLIAARVLQGIGSAMLVPTSLALVLEAYPATSRSKGVALWSAAAALAAGVGPATGGLLVELSGWRLAFLVNLPVGIGIFIVTGRTIVESRSPGKRAVPDLPGSALLAVSIASLVLAIVKSNDWGLLSPGVLLSVGVFVATLVLFGRRTRRHRAPLVDLDLLRVPAFALANVLTVLGSMAFYAYLLCNVLFLTTVWGYSVLDAGLALTPGPFIAAAVSGVAAKVVTRFGYRAALTPGALIWAGGIVWMMTRTGTQPELVSVWLPGMVLLGIGAGIVFPTLGSLVVAASPGASFATSTALNSVARQLGAALGVAMLVAVVGTPGPAGAVAAFDHGWTLSAVTFVLVGVLALGLRGVSSVTEAPVIPVRSGVTGTGRSLRVTAGAGAVGRLSAFFAEAAAPVNETVQDVLARTSWFGVMPASTVAAIAQDATTRLAQAGDVVYAEGDTAETIYVVRSGRVEVRRYGADAELVELGRGTVLGAVTALARGSYGESVVALRETELIVVDRGTVVRLAGLRPDLSLALVTSTSRRLEQAPRTPTRPQPPAVIAIVPIDARVKIRDLTSRLADSCGRLGTSGLLYGTERKLTQGESASTVYGPLLARSERDVDRTLLVCSADRTDLWSAFCLQHADRVLVVTSAAIGEPPPGLADLRGSDLVVLGEEPTPPAIVEALAPRATHRVGNDPDDVDRLARRLAGRSVGIVLAGGGARAFAHIGVVSELLSAGIRIDRVGGTSMGAYVGALLACGMSPQEVDACCYDHWVRSSPLTDYTLPRTSLIRGNAMRSMLEEVFGDKRIEDLHRSFYCVSSDLRAQAKFVHREGPLGMAVGYSSCLPIVAPPQVVGRQLLVDGALLDNLPVQDMASTGEGPVLAIDIKSEIERPQSPSNGVVREARTPALAETLARVFWLASANTSAQAALHADRLIEVRVGAVGLLEFHQIDVAVAAGAKAARAALDEYGPTLGLA